MLSEAAEAYYKHIVDIGGRVRLGNLAGHERPLAQELTRLALLEPGTDADELVVVDPRLAKIKIGAPYYQAALDTLSAARMLPNVVARLSSEFHQRIPTDAPTSGTSEVLTGKTQVAQRLAALTERCTTELLHLRPKLSEEDDEEALRREVRAIARPGLTWRTILRTSARFVPAHRAYATAIVESGGETRTEDLVIEPLLIIDRTTAVIPADLDADPAGREAVCLIANPAAVDYLRGVFLTMWDQARPFTPDANTADAVEGLQDSILHLLGEGLDQAAIANELGLAPRTLTNYISALKKQYRVSSLFQLGNAVARSN